MARDGDRYKACLRGNGRPLRKWKFRWANLICRNMGKGYLRLPPLCPPREFRLLVTYDCFIYCVTYIIRFEYSKIFTTSIVSLEAPTVNTNLFTFWQVLTSFHARESSVLDHKGEGTCLFGGSWRKEHLLPYWAKGDSDSFWFTSGTQHQPNAMLNRLVKSPNMRNITAFRVCMKSEVISQKKNREDFQVGVYFCNGR